MPERSKATILGVRVERIIFGYCVEDGSTMHPIGAARAIVQFADQKQQSCPQPQRQGIALPGTLEPTP
jgi:hypothetical protein